MGTKHWGLALGGGGVYGFAHLGVLQVLRKAGLQPSHISGTSAGSIVASMYACGISLTAIEQFAVNTLGQLTVQDHNGGLTSALSIKGLVPGGLIEKAIDIVVAGRLVRDAYLRLYIEAVDINSGRLVVFAGEPQNQQNLQQKVLWRTDAKISTAVRASIAIPGMFWPKQLDDMQLVDGAVLDVVPVKSLWLSGVSPIVAVDIGKYAEKPSRPDNLYSILTRAFSIQARELTLKTLAECADLTISPELGDMDVWNLTGVSECIKRGAQAAEERLQDLIRLLNL